MMKMHTIISTREITDMDLTEDWNFTFRFYTFPLIQKSINYDSLVEDRIFSLAKENINAFFTSESAVKSVLSRLEQCPTWQLFALGGKTKETLLQFFPAVQSPRYAKNSTELAEQVRENRDLFTHQKNVFFCGDKRMPTIPRVFEALNIPLEEVICYKSTCQPSSISGPIQGMLFFSPSAVECFFKHNKSIHEQTVLFAIGDTTAGAISKYCTNKVVVAPKPSEASLLHEVKKYFEVTTNN